METTIIALKNTSVGNDNKQQMMTSLEIAELTGKNHFDLMRAIRKMEPAWEKVQGCKFALLQRTLRTLSALSNFFRFLLARKRGNAYFCIQDYQKRLWNARLKSRIYFFY